jgi:hypothetical protein
VAGDGASLAVAGGGEFLAAADRAERSAVAVRGGTSSVAIGGETFLVADGGAARMTGGGYIGTSGGVGGEPLAVVRGDKTPGRAALTFSQGSTGGTLLVAAGREPWSVTDGGGQVKAAEQASFDIERRHAAKN